MRWLKGLAPAANLRMDGRLLELLPPHPTAGMLKEISQCEDAARET